MAHDNYCVTNPIGFDGRDKKNLKFFFFSNFFVSSKPRNAALFTKLI